MLTSNAGASNARADWMGKPFTIAGLAATKLDVLARLERTDGVTQTVRVLPDSPSFRVETTPSGWNVSATYLRLGIEHILLGIDHLLFVLALVLLVKGWKRLVGHDHRVHDCTQHLPSPLPPWVSCTCPVRPSRRASR